MRKLVPSPWASLAALLAIASSHSARADSPDPLDSLRLLPPVLVKGEPGSTLDERMRHYKVEGVSIAVIKDFKILWAAGHGLADREAKDPVTTETLFQAGSISKPVAAAGVLRKVQAGALRLDRDVNELLKSWKLPQNELTAKRKVTLELLLSHRAGLTVHGFPGYAVGAPVPTVPQVLDGAPPANTAPVRVDLEPGSKWRYSGGGYTIAQLVMTDVFGRPFPALMRELVLGPAGMAHSTYEQPLPADLLGRAAAGYRRDGSPLPGKRHTYPEMAAAGLWTTAGDLARFGIAVQRSLRGDANSLLSRDVAQRMVTPILGDDGLGLFVQKHGTEVYVGHDGADEGFQALLLVHRDKGYGAAVMANSDSGLALAHEIVRGLARQYGWEGYLPEPIETVRLSAQELAPLSGRYQVSGDEALSLEMRQGRLYARMSLEGECELFAIAGGGFLCKDGPIRLQVERSQGRVTALVALLGEERRVAKRMGARARLPSDDLEAGKIDAALASYRKLAAERPDDPGIREQRLNNMGYTLAGRKELAKAIAILKLNTELYPASSNTYDSLGEIYLASGDRERSLACYRKVLEVLPTDTKTDPALKAQLRRNAEAKVKELAERPR